MSAGNTAGEVQKIPGVPFQKGYDPRRNTNGRPLGSVSIVGRAKQILQDDPTKLEEIVKDLLNDKNLRIELIRQIDGMPRQALGIEGGLEIKPIMGGTSKASEGQNDGTV